MNLIAVFDVTLTKTIQDGGFMYPWPLDYWFQQNEYEMLFIPVFLLLNAFLLQFSFIFSRFVIVKIFHFFDAVVFTLMYGIL